MFHPTFIIATNMIATTFQNNSMDSTPTTSAPSPPPTQSSARDLIVETYKTYVTNSTPDKKLVTYWSNIISKGDKTLDDFKVYLSKHTDYLNAIKSIFVDFYYDHLSCTTETNNQDLFDAMLIEVGDGKLLTTEDIWHYISHCLPFENEYRAILTKMFQTIYGTTPSDAEIHICIERIRENTAYTIEMLQKDVETFYARGMHRLAASITTTLNGVPGGVSYGSGGMDAAMMASSSAGLNGMPLPPIIPEGIAPDLELVDQYEDVFKRPMNVREYILYIQDLRARRGDASYLVSLYDKQCKYYQDIKDILHVYLDKYISEEQFLIHYLSKINDNQYIQLLRKEVIQSKEYSQKMTRKLQTIYRNLYGELMSQEDVDYLFERLKSKELGLNDDSLNERVAEFREENDDIIQRVFDIYFDVFDREPDVHEQNNSFKFIRQHIDDEDKRKVDGMIALDLKESLEYHDVLKRKIAKVYAKHSGDVLFPSKMYHVLNKVLPMKHLTSIDAHVEQVVLDMVSSGPGAGMAAVSDVKDGGIQGAMDASLGSLAIHTTPIDGGFDNVLA
jgi:hypothetical protein